MSDKPWTVTQSRYVLRDRWLTVRADECITSRGAVLKPYYVVERPDFVAVLAIDPDDHVILVQQYRHGLGVISLELPGGILDDGEIDPVAVARRELAEETGYQGGRFRALVALGVQPASASNRAHLVLAEDVEPGVAHPEASEDITVVRVPRAEARTLAISGAILNAKHVGFLLLGLARLDADSSAMPDHRAGEGSSAIAYGQRATASQPVLTYKAGPTTSD